MVEPEKLIRDGKVAVLVSPGFGAGWSTWIGKDAEFATFDKGLVELVERKASSDEAEAYLEFRGIKDAYMGGWSDVEVDWLPVGTSFYIHEYDGSESIKYRESDGWYEA